MNIEQAKQYDYEEERIDFTTRQQEVAEKLASKTHDSIADDLGVSKSTVDTHASNINDIVGKYPELVEVMLHNLVQLEDDDAVRQIARRVQNASYEVEGLEVNIED